VSKIPNPQNGYRWATHELGHGFESKINNVIPTKKDVRDLIPENTANRSGFAGPFNGWQQSDRETRGEIFADMFLGWTYDRWEEEDGRLTDPAALKADFMNQNMPSWIALVINRNRRNSQ
jgi:hypothetical protein